MEPVIDALVSQIVNDSRDSSMTKMNILLAFDENRKMEILWTIYLEMMREENLLAKITAHGKKKNKLWLRGKKCKSKWPWNDKLKMSDMEIYAWDKIKSKLME